MKSSDEHSVEDANRFLKDHDRPTYDQLERLIQKGTPEALETLRHLADDHNVDWDDDTKAQELTDKIALAIDEEINH